MSAVVGSTIGRYSIVSMIGAGGMGEVYRAHDPDLKRDVAIKVMRPSFLADADRATRFRREAQLLATLNHPNVAQVYGVESGDGVTALVMELLDGEDLSVRISRGPIPVDQAVTIVCQIASALEAAHDRGIIHRDLKPANIKIQADGGVKVLDFGLAKITNTASSEVDALNSPTLSLHATEAGVVLGTAAYMSPEQARGKSVDRRSDMWSLGCVLFEMLTGRRAFDADDATDAMVAVISKEPDWSLLPAETGPGLPRLIRWCLEKDQRRRLDSAAVLRVELEETKTSSHISGEPHRPTGGGRKIGAALIAALILIVAAATAFDRLNRSTADPLHASILLPEGYVLGDDDPTLSLPSRTPFVFTPDGRTIIIQASRDGVPALFLRSLDSAVMQPIEGTHEARTPFVSADGKWLGFWSRGFLKKVPLNGGAVQEIAPVAGLLGPVGAAWSGGGDIVFGDLRSGRIMHVSENGGTPTPITPVPALRRTHSAPSFLPDGKRVLFSDVSTRDNETAQLMLQPLSGGEPSVVLGDAVDGRVLPSGYLLYMRSGTLMSVPFDAVNAVPTGAPQMVMTGVMQSGLRSHTGAANTAAGMFAISSRGTLAFIPGPLVGPAEGRLQWVDFDGSVSTAEATAGAPVGRRLAARIAPDGQQAVVSLSSAKGRETWFVNWQRDVWSRCEGCETSFGVWSPDGSRLMFTQNDSLIVRTADGSAVPVVRTNEQGKVLFPVAWLDAGKVVYMSSTANLSENDIKVLEPGASSGTTVATLGSGHSPALSPDKRWLAFTAAMGGRMEVVVQAFPGPGPRLQVSAGGGMNPAWSADSKTIYYASNGVMNAVNLLTSPRLGATKPKEIFRRREPLLCSPMRCFDVSPDGRFLIQELATEKRQTATRIDLVVNWQLPTKR